MSELKGHWQVCFPKSLLQKVFEASTQCTVCNTDAMGPTIPSNPSPENPYRRIFTLLKWYGGAIAVVFLLQLFPLTGVFLMFFAASLWIGIIIHLFMINVVVEALTGRMPRAMLVIPGAFYATGIGVGLCSDVMAARWKASQEWLRIDKQIPADVHYLTFDPMIDDRRLNDPTGIFRPETLGFELASIAREDGRQVVSGRLVVHSLADPWCFNRGPKIRKVGDRCFKIEPIKRSAAFLRVGGPFEGRYPTHSPPQDYFWGTIYERQSNLVLHQHGQEDQVGRIQGATIDKPFYVILPFIGCGLVGSRSAWECDWRFTLKLRQQFVGFAFGVTSGSPEAPSLLMTALRRLRGDVPAAQNP